MGNNQSEENPDEFILNPGSISDGISGQEGRADFKMQSAKLESLSQKFKLKNVGNTSFGATASVRSICVVLEGCLTFSIQVSDSIFTTDWLNSQVIRKCREMDKDTSSRLALPDFLCLESVCRNYLTDWQLSQPGAIVRLWTEEILLRPVYRVRDNFDGTIDDSLFQRGKILGSGGFSKVYLGNIE